MVNGRKEGGIELAKRRTNLLCPGVYTVTVQQKKLYQMLYMYIHVNVISNKTYRVQI